MCHPAGLTFTDTNPVAKDISRIHSVASIRLKCIRSQNFSLKQSTLRGGRVKFLNCLFKGVEWFLVALLTMMVTLVFFNVVLRYVFNYGIVFSEEVSRFMFMWITLIGALVVMKDNGHLGMSSVISLFGERGRRICRFLADLMTLGVALLVKGSWQHVLLGMEDMAPADQHSLGIIQSSLLVSSFGIGLFVRIPFGVRSRAACPRKN